MTRLVECGMISSRRLALTWRVYVPSPSCLLRVGPLSRCWPLCRYAVRGATYSCSGCSSCRTEHRRGRPLDETILIVAFRSALFIASWRRWADSAAPSGSGWSGADTAGLDWRRWTLRRDTVGG